LQSIVQHHRLFSAGRNPQKLVVLRFRHRQSAHVLSHLRRSRRRRFEPRTSSSSPRAKAWSTSSTKTRPQVQRNRNVKTEFGAKTMGLDTKTHNIFLSTVDFAPLPLRPPTIHTPTPRHSQAASTSSSTAIAVSSVGTVACALSSIRRDATLVRPLRRPSVAYALFTVEGACALSSISPRRSRPTSRAFARPWNGDSARTTNAVLTGLKAFVECV